MMYAEGSGNIDCSCVQLKCTECDDEFSIFICAMHSANEQSDGRALNVGSFMYDYLSSHWYSHLLAIAVRRGNYGNPI